VNVGASPFDSLGHTPIVSYRSLHTEFTPIPHVPIQIIYRWAELRVDNRVMFFNFVTGWIDDAVQHP
jgi:hypothetical protein